MEGNACGAVDARDFAQEGAVQVVLEHALSMGVRQIEDVLARYGNVGLCEALFLLESDLAKTEDIVVYDEVFTISSGQELSVPYQTRR